MTEPRAREGVVREDANWRETWHEYVEGRIACARCGYAADRAIHSRKYASDNGYEFIDAQGYDVGATRG